MYMLVGFGDFCDAFRNYDRNENFSYEGKKALFDFIEEIEEDEVGQELDVIALCCDYSEDTQDEIARNYNIDIEEVEYLLENNTFYIKLDNGNYLYQVF